MILGYPQMSFVIPLLKHRTVEAVVSDGVECACEVLRLSFPVLALMLSVNFPQLNRLTVVKKN